MLRFQLHISYFSKYKISKHILLIYTQYKYIYFKFILLTINWTLYSMFKCSIKIPGQSRKSLNNNYLNYPKMRNEIAIFSLSP